MTYRESNVEWLDSVSLTSIINISIGSGGSGWVSRIWQSQYGTLDMSLYNIMWCYMLSTLTNNRIKKKNSRHCHIDFIALKEITKGGGNMGKYGENSSLLYENAVLVNMTDRGYSLPAGISVYMRPANERRHYNVKTFLMGWAYTQTDPLYSEGEILSLSLG